MDSSVGRRLRLGLVLAAVGLVAATALRTARLADARPGADVLVRAVNVASIDGGVFVQATPGGWTVRSLRSGDDRPLTPGTPLMVGKAQLVLDPADGLRRTEIFRRPWSVFAPEHDGHRRIDVGPDPLGAVDGVRDRIVVPAGPGGGGWLHLVPRTAERFGPDDAGAAAVVIERDGLSVDGDLVHAGERREVGARFEVSDGSTRVEVRWEAAVRAVPVLGDDGGIVGYRSAVGTDLVVSALEVGGDSGRTHLEVLDRAGTSIDRVTLSSKRPTLLHGRRDRISPLRGRVLPPIAANEELELAVGDGLSAGWVRVGADRTTVEIPPNDALDGPRSDLGWTLSGALVDLVARYDRARAPVAVRPGPGLRAAGATALDDRGERPLRYDADLDAWTPSERPVAAGPVVFRLPVASAAPEVTLSAAFPIAWATSSEGPWRAEPSPPPGRFREWSLPVEGADAVYVRLDATVAPFERPGAAAVAVAVAGAPEGTFLDAEGARVGTRAFEAWSSSRTGADRAAARLWRRLPGDHWSVEADVGEATEAASRLYLRVPLQARTAGWTALDLTVPGRVVGATWNDEPLTHAGLAHDPHGGAGRLSVPTRRGRNLLALEVELPPRAPAAQAGGVRFRLDDAGLPVGLDDRVADRRSRSPVRVATPSAPLNDTDGADAPWLEVERAGGGDLRVGERFRVAPAPRVDATAVLTLASPTRTLVTPVPDEEGQRLLVTSDAAGGLAVTSPVAGTLWTTGGRPLTVVPHVATDWPPGARLVLQGHLLRLRRPRAAEEAELSARPAWLGRWDPEAGPVTLDDDLQADVAAALDAELEELPDADGDTLALRGVVLVLDGRSGDILACAAVDRPDADPDTAVREPCWQDAGVHPGSTFKLATAGAALRSSDPAVRRMLDGSAPIELVRDGPRGTLKGVKLPALPAGARPILLRTRLRNFRGQPAPTDADLTDAIRGSYNTWFGYLGLLLHRPLREGWIGSAVADGEARNAAWPVAAYAREAGFDQRWDLGGGYVGTGGHVPSDAPDSDAAIAARSIGQDAVTATPAGIATLLAAAAEGGRAPVPRLSRDRAVEHRELLSAPRAERIREGLAAVVSRGTASTAFAENPRRDRILGKTGSAQRIDGNGLQRTDAWFAGAVLPPEGTDEASLVVVVAMPGAGLGGRHAARLGDAVSRKIAALRGW